MVRAVMILTYKRMKSVLALLRRLMGLPFMNKIVIVWNNPEPPHHAVQWPDVGVPLQVCDNAEKD
jgi:alpha-1,4-N-acetylglucosaminyltransferase EXTL3